MHLRRGRYRQQCRAYRRNGPLVPHAGDYSAAEGRGLSSLCVILSGATNSPCEVVAESKDPYELIGSRTGLALQALAISSAPLRGYPIWLLLPTAYAVGYILCAALRLECQCVIEFTPS